MIKLTKCVLEYYGHTSRFLDENDRLKHAASSLKCYMTQALRASCSA